MASTNDLPQAVFNAIEDAIEQCHRIRKDLEEALGGRSTKGLRRAARDALNTLGSQLQMLELCRHAQRELMKGAS